MSDLPNIKHAQGMSEFESMVLTSDHPYVLVDFWAEWCTPCRLVAPVLEELAQSLGEKFQVVKVDVDQNPDVAGMFNVMSIPTLILFKKVEGQEKKDATISVGFRPKPVMLQWLHEQGMDISAAAG